MVVGYLDIHMQKIYILQSIPQALLKNYFKMYQRPKSKLKIIKLLKANLGENIGQANYFMDIQMYNS